MAKAASKNNNALYVLIGFAILVAALMYVFMQKMELKKAALKQQSQGPQIVSENYKCNNSRTIDAVYVNGDAPSVELNLSDGRQLNLQQTISADGGRYANWDNSVVFWSKGDTAFIQEGQTNTYDNCTVAKQN